MPGLASAEQMGGRKPVGKLRLQAKVGAGGTALQNGFTTTRMHTATSASTGTSLKKRNQT